MQAHDSSDFRPYVYLRIGCPFPEKGMRWGPPASLPGKLPSDGPSIFCKFCKTNAYSPLAWPRAVRRRWSSPFSRSELFAELRRLDAFAVELVLRAESAGGSLVKPVKKYKSYTAMQYEVTGGCRPGPHQTKLQCLFSIFNSILCLT